MAKEHHNGNAQSRRPILSGDAKEKNLAASRSRVFIQGLRDLQVLGTFAFIIVQDGIRIGILADVGKSIAYSILLQLINGQPRDTTAGTIENRRHPQTLQVRDVSGMILGTDENTSALNQGWLWVNEIWAAIYWLGDQPTYEIQARLQRIIRERKFLQEGVLNAAGRVSFQGRHVVKATLEA